jgi:hypothetical protein
MTRNELPSMARAVAILNIVLGALGLLATPCSGLMFLDSSSKDPVVQAIRSDPLLLGWTLGSIAFGMLLSVVAIAASAALLNVQPWSRWVLLGEASCQIFLSLLGLAVHGLILTPRVLQIAERTGDTAEKYGMLGGLVGGSIGSLFAIVFPILTLVVLTRPETIAALRTGENTTARHYPPRL